MSKKQHYCAFITREEPYSYAWTRQDVFLNLFIVSCKILEDHLKKIYIFISAGDRLKTAKLLTNNAFEDAACVSGIVIINGGNQYEDDSPDLPSNGRTCTTLYYWY